VIGGVQTAPSLLNRWFKTSTNYNIQQA